MKFLILFFLFACQSSMEWIETPLYPGSLNAVLTGSHNVLKRYSNNIKFEKMNQSFETQWYNPDSNPVPGFTRRAKIIIQVYGTSSPFTFAGRVFYEESDGGPFYYAGELPKHARNILRQILIEAETIDGNFNTIDRVKVF